MPDNVQDFSVFLDSPNRTTITVHSEYLGRASAVEELTGVSRQADLVAPATRLAREARTFDAQVDGRRRRAHAVLEDLGDRLGQLLLPGHVAEQFKEALETASTLRLRISCRDPWLEALPWELARHPVNDRGDARSGRSVWLAKDHPRIWMVRDTISDKAFGDHRGTLPGPIGVIDATQATSPVLGIGLSLPTDFSSVPVKAWSDELGSSLAAGGPLSGVVYLGHGTAPARERPGALLMRRYAGSKDVGRVYGDDFASAVRRSRAALAVLVACNSGSSVPDQDENQAPGTIVASLTQAPHDEHVPIVLGMQHSLEETMAQRFLDTFFTELGSGVAIEEALRRSRQAMADGRPQYEAAWSTPVLFLNAKTGDLFNRNDHENKALAPVGPADASPDPSASHNAGPPPLVIRHDDQEWILRADPAGPTFHPGRRGDRAVDGWMLALSADGRVSAQLIGRQLQLAWVSRGARTDRFPHHLLLPDGLRLLAVARGGTRSALCLLSGPDQTDVVEVVYGAPEDTTWTQVSDRPSGCGVFDRQQPVIYDEHGRPRTTDDSIPGLDAVHHIDAAVAGGRRVMVVTGDHHGQQATLWTATTGRSSWPKPAMNVLATNQRLTVGRDVQGRTPDHLYGEDSVIVLDHLLEPTEA